MLHFSKDHRHPFVQWPAPGRYDFEVVSSPERPLVLCDPDIPGNLLADKGEDSRF